MHHFVNWRSAAYSGIAAGIAATLAQIALWSVFTDTLPISGSSHLPPQKVRTSFQKVPSYGHFRETP